MRACLVSVAKRFARGGAGGEHEVRSVQSSTGCLVDDEGSASAPWVQPNHATTCGASRQLTEYRSYVTDARCRAAVATKIVRFIHIRSGEPHSIRALSRKL